MMLIKKILAYDCRTNSGNNVCIGTYPKTKTKSLKEN